MKRSKHLWAIVGICIAVMLTGCSQSLPGDAGSNTTPAADETEQTESITVKDENEIIQDLSEREDFFTLFDSNYGTIISGSAYTIDELTIVRRKIDEAAGTDTVYATIISSSEEGKYTGDFCLLYSLYDVGGWYLESIELESGSLEALAGVSEAEAFNFVLEYLSVLGAGPEDCSIKNTYTMGEEFETVVVALDFADDVVSVNGELEFNFYFDGARWNYTYTDDFLNSDILIDGTYQCTDCIAQPQYLTVTHENGNLLIYHAQSWDGGIDPFHLREGVLDGVTRSYTAVDGDITREYYFGSDGIISYSYNGMAVGTFHRITNATTNSKGLWDAVRKAGIA